jgi:hypothetical protein
MVPRFLVLYCSTFIENKQKYVKINQCIKADNNEMCDTDGKAITRMLRAAELPEFILVFMAKVIIDVLSQAVLINNEEKPWHEPDASI